MTDKLKPCPCGKTPERIDVVSSGGCKYAQAMPSCCNEWLIEFRTVRFSLDSPETHAAAVKAWNEAPRGCVG